MNPNTGAPYADGKLGAWVGGWLQKAGLRDSPSVVYKNFTNQMLRNSHISTFGGKLDDKRAYQQLLGHHENAHRRYYRVLEDLYMIFPFAEIVYIQENLRAEAISKKEADALIADVHRRFPGLGTTKKRLIKKGAGIQPNYDRRTTA